MGGGIMRGRRHACARCGKGEKRCRGSEVDAQRRGCEVDVQGPPASGGRGGCGVAIAVEGYSEMESVLPRVPASPHTIEVIELLGCVTTTLVIPMQRTATSKAIPPFPPGLPRAALASYRLPSTASAITGRRERHIIGTGLCRPHLFARNPSRHCTVARGESLRQAGAARVVAWRSLRRAVCDNWTRRTVRHWHGAVPPPSLRKVPLTTLHGGTRRKSSLRKQMANWQRGPGSDAAFADDSWRAAPAEMQRRAELDQPFKRALKGRGVLQFGSGAAPAEAAGAAPSCFGVGRVCRGRWRPFRGGIAPGAVQRSLRAAPRSW